MPFDGPPLHDVAAPLLWHQWRFVTSTAHRVLLCGGYGTGKTHALAWKCHALAEANAGTGRAIPSGLILEPYWRLFERAFLPEVWKIADQIGTDVVYKGQKQELHFYFEDGRRFVWFLASTDKEETLVGSNVSALLVDEPGLIAQGAWQRFNSRLRVPAPLMQAAMAGTPEGIGGRFYEYAEGDLSKGVDVVRASTRANIFLPPDPETWIAENLNAFTPEEVEAYVEGRFVALRGRVYPRYDRERHGRTIRDLGRDPGAGELWMAVDFGQHVNVYLMGTRYPDDVTHVWGELLIQNKRTEEAAPMAREWWEDWAADNDEDADYLLEHLLTVYPDASGNYTSWQKAKGVAKTDVELLREQGFQVATRKKNLPVRDRVTSLNVLCRDDRLFVDPERCPHTHKSMQFQGYGVDGEPEKTDQTKTRELGLDHAPDALGYYVVGSGQITRAYRANSGVHRRR